MHRLPTLVLWFALLLPSLAFAIEPAGTVIRLQGSATATMPNGFARPLYVDSTVLVGDRLDTAAGSRLQVRMNDGAMLTLGENSSLSVDVYRRDDEADSLAVLRMISGVFLGASGAIARFGSDRFTIETPSAVLGVRGTEVWGNVGEDKLEVALLSGTGVTVITPQGSVEMTLPGSGVTVITGQAPPEPKLWGQPRLDAAADSVRFEGD